MLTLDEVQQIMYLSFILSATLQHKTNLRIEHEHHLGSDGHITEALLVPEVLEGGHHVGLEVIPPKTELLIVSHGVLIP